MKVSSLYKTNGDVKFMQYIRHVVQKEAGCIRNKNVFGAGFYVYNQ